MTHDIRTYCAVKKYLPISGSLFLYNCHTYMFQIIKQILISDKDNPSKQKQSF